MASRAGSRDCAEPRPGGSPLRVPAGGFPGLFGGPEGGRRGPPVGVMGKEQKVACPGSSFCFPVRPLPLLVGSRVGGRRLKLHFPPFSRTLPFPEAYSQARQEAGTTPGPQSWVRVVHCATGQRQRGSEHYVPKHPTTSSPILTGHVPLKSSKPRPLQLLLSILQVFSPLPMTHLLAWGPWGTRIPGCSILRGPWPPNGRWALGPGPGWRGTDTLLDSLQQEPSRWKRERFGRRTKRVGVKGCVSHCTEGAPRTMLWTRVGAWQTWAIGRFHWCLEENTLKRRHQ